MSATLSMTHVCKSLRDSPEGEEVVDRGLAGKQLAVRQHQAELVHRAPAVQIRCNHELCILTGLHHSKHIRWHH